jgi:hypothetical protein
MSESKSLLARLLAKENINVQHGNYTTAYFDVKNRILGLPLWKDDDKDLYDMLVGHEVGHALYTPAEGWFDIQSAAKDDHVPGDYLNVVEDIRIERKIQEIYPGIVRSFKKGYTYLNESDFFGIRGRDHNRMGLMDRINLKAKLRDLIDVEFSDVERPLVDRAFAANTWDEVVEVARELYEFMQNNPDSHDQTKNDGEQQKQQDQESSSQTDPTSGSSDENNDSEESETNDSQDSQNDQSSSRKDSDDADQQGSGSSEENTGSSKDEKFEPTNDNNNEDEVETYRRAQENAGDLLETSEDGGVPLVLHGFYRRQMNDIIVPFSKVRESRERAYDRFLEHLDAAVANEKNAYTNEDWKKRQIEEANTDADYKEFILETKRVVNVMAKEFELRKAAHQYSRASTARSGSLDLERLHEYRTNDDIFRRVTTLADAKSHGMVMLIDNSASMHDARGPVISQVLNLAMFCKRVNIPFDVYSFTNRSIDVERADDGRDHDEYVPPEALSHRNTMLTHVLSSSFNRRDYDTAYRQLFDLSRNTLSSEGQYDRMSGTPLNDILTGMHLLLKDFKQKHQIEKTIFTVLTDGDSNTLSATNEVVVDNLHKRRNGIRVILDESRRTVNLTGRRCSTMPHAVTTELLDAIRREVPGVVNVGYFVANTSNDFTTAFDRATHGGGYDQLREARRIANREKFISYDNTLGYDRYFILKANRAKDLEATDDEFKVSDKAKRGEITRAFKKYAKSKKGNRVMATQFAEIIS